MTAGLPAKVVHVAPVEISLQSGMGRVAWHWRAALRGRGITVHHVGPTEIGPLFHQALMPQAAWRTARALHGAPDLYMVHEPLAGAFVGRGVPVIAFSHGLERRHWEQRVADPERREGALSLKTRLLFPAWRISQCDAAMRGADRLFLINQQDRAYALERYHRRDEDIFVFPNGVDPVTARVDQSKADSLRVVFNGSWIVRKGIRVLVDAATAVAQQGVGLRWQVMGSGYSEEEVRRDWPAQLQDSLEVIPRFEGKEEAGLLARAQVLVLPSFYEGMPLSMLQAMAMGLCPVASDCCGQRDVIQHRVNGMLHAPGDAGQLAEHLVALARDPVMRRRLGQHAASSVEQLTWSNVAGLVADQVVETYARARISR